MDMTGRWADKQKNNNENQGGRRSACKKVKLTKKGRGKIPDK